MPEEETQTEEPFKFEVPDQDWLSRPDNMYICHVELGGDDCVQLESMSGKLGDDLDALIGIATGLIPDDHDDLGDLELVQQALRNGLSDDVWEQIDKMLERYVKEWDLSTYADATRQSEFKNPQQINDKDERMEALKALPIPVLARTLYGLAWHTRNFT